MLRGRTGVYQAAMSASWLHRSSVGRVETNRNIRLDRRPVSYSEDKGGGIKNVEQLALSSFCGAHRHSLLLGARKLMKTWLRETPCRCTHPRRGHRLIYA
jgi:hypothetical protein